MAKNKPNNEETPDFESEDTSLLDDMSARESAVSKLDSILGKSPRGVGRGVDITPKTAEERSDDRRVAMEERRRVRNSRIEAGAAKDSARIRRAAGIEPAAPKEPKRKDNSIMRAIREEPDFEPETPSAGRSRSASEAGAWLRDNPQAEAELRALGRSVDENAAAAFRARTSGRATHFDFGTGLPREQTGIFDPTAQSKMQDIVGNERIGGGGGIMSANENAAISTDFDPADVTPSVKAGPAFAEPAHIASPFEAFKEKATADEKLALNVGVLYLKRSGRCNHPLCNMFRARGLQLSGKPVASRQFGQGVESNLPAIPSIATEKPYYPINPETGKEDRKNRKTYIELSPADPTGVDWETAKSMMSRDEMNLFSPEDLLEHHHGPGDMDFERHIPWHPNYRGPQ